MIQRLFVYGTLAPGRSNAHVLASVRGAWEPATVTGTLFAEGWGAAAGYPGIVLHDDGDEVKGLLFTSDELPLHWARLDTFEGDGYERVPVTARRSDGTAVEAFVYALRPGPSHRVAGDAPGRIDRGDLHWIAAEDVAGPGAGAPYQHPHLVVQDDVLNHSRIDTVVVVALTSNLHRASEPGNVLLDEGEGGLPRRSVIVVSQIASVEKRRLGARIGALSQARVDAALAGLRFQQRSFFRR